LRFLFFVFLHFFFFLPLFERKRAVAFAAALSASGGFPVAFSYMVIKLQN
jgi:hypothetical protein